MRELTDRSFAVNHTLRPLNEEAFQATLDERPAEIVRRITDDAETILRRTADACTRSAPH
ncbi:hypothetical protein [Streptomyces sp. enrichment culture]|uniref:hypothetical protein n=1 Tax=Streptomyces sp. enrichment culture TaxID=1795815 RepID=UPI003F554BEB